MSLSSQFHPIPPAGRGYGFLSNREEEDEDPFHDIDYENDPL